MKKILFCLVTLLCSYLSYAQTIHWVTFIDTTDPDVGRFDINTRQILYSRWINVINAALAPKGYNSDIQDFYGDRTSPENCKSAIENLICQPEDIIVFYYIGHGARSIDDKSPYPQMLLAQNYDNKCVPLIWVHNQLKNKGVRFVLTIGMCCNGYDENLTAKENIAFGLNKGSSYSNSDEISNIQKLFLGTKGDIIVASCKPDQSSWACYKNDIGLTDYFSYHLMKEFGKAVKQSAEPNWQTLFSQISSIVNNETLADSRTSKVEQQTPIFDVNVNSSEQAPVPTPEPPTKDTNKDLLNEYTEFFDYLIDPRIPISKRIEAAETVKHFFAENAVVKILGQDTNNVIDRETADTFIDRISGSRILLKIVVVNGFCNENDKVTELQVREYYKK